MKVSGRISSDRLGDTETAARALEDLGYDSVLTIETQHDPFLPLTLAAEHTRRLELMTGIAVAFARNPMTLANLGHDLNAFSKGRIILGLGAQIPAHITRRFSMPWSAPAARMREMIGAMNAIWDCWYEGKTLDFRGEHYTHTIMTPYFTPTNTEYGRPRVMVAAVGPHMTRTAAEASDGMLCHAFTTARYLTEVTIPTVEQAIAAKGRDRSKFEIVASLFVAAGDTDEEIETGRKAARNAVSFYGSTPAYKGVFELEGWHDLQPKLNALSKQGKWAEMEAAIPDEVLDAFLVQGTPEQVVEKRQALFAGKVDRAALGFSVADPDREKALVRLMREA